MDFAYLTQFFIQGDVRGAMEYMDRFPELQDISAGYRDLFAEGHFLHYDVPEILNTVLLAYQKYFRDVFYLRISEEAASRTLLFSLMELVNAPSEEELPTALTKLFEANGYHIQTGVTNGHYGPYVWKETEERRFPVELPEGVYSYPVRLLRGFVMRSWMDYVTFGRFGTGGWADPDGIICCVESAYDLESEKFRISLLKHEAQHLADMARWPRITPAELEYRAKLVELTYSENPGLLDKFISEADPSRTNDSHAVASSLLAVQMGSLAGGPVEKIQECAAALLKESSGKIGSIFPG